MTTQLSVVDLNNACHCVFSVVLANIVCNLVFDLRKSIQQIAKDSPDSELLSSAKEVQVTCQQNPAVATIRDPSTYLSRSKQKKV